jgi:hypothetical protein
MERKNMIIFMILSLISLVWIILSYYGYDRFLMVRIFGFQSYSEKYIDLPKAKSDKKVVVSLFTKKQNLEDIRPTINSILDQTVRPDQITLSCNKAIEMPDCISKNFVILQHVLSKDYADISPLLSPLLREKDADSKIIVLKADSGNIYGKDLIQVLVEESEKYPDSIIYVKGYIARHFVDTAKKIDNPETNDIIEIDYGVLVKPKFFKEDVLMTKSIQAANATLSAYSSDTHKQKINYTDSFIFQKHNDKEAEKLGAIYYASRLSSFK